MPTVMSSSICSNVAAPMQLISRRPPVLSEVVIKGSLLPGDAYTSVQICSEEKVVLNNNRLTVERIFLE
jgi:hypothetical protein